MDEVKFWAKSPLGVIHILRNHRGGGGFQVITLDYEGEGGLFDDYVIKNILIFHKF